MGIQMKNAGYLIMFLVLGTVFLGQIRDFSEDGDFIIHANVINTGTRDADDLRISIYVPELSLFYRTNRFDLNDGENTAKFVYGSAYGAPPGPYITIVTLSSSTHGTLDRRFLYTLI